jgi:hypothetical protein
MNAGDWVTAIAAAVQAGAVVAAGIWAYFKFVRGRTFAHRAEPGLSAQRLGSSEAEAIRAAVTLRNTGASDIPLRVKAVLVYGITADEWSGGDRSPRWEQVAIEPVFEHHEKIEAQETIADEVLIPLPNHPAPLAYKVELVVLNERKKPGATQWTTAVVLPETLMLVAPEATMTHATKPRRWINCVRKKSRRADRGR